MIIIRKNALATKVFSYMLFHPASAQWSDRPYAVIEIDQDSLPFELWRDMSSYFFSFSAAQTHTHCSKSDSYTQWETEINSHAACTAPPSPPAAARTANIFQIRIWQHQPHIRYVNNIRTLNHNRRRRRWPHRQICPISTRHRTYANLYTTNNIYD